MSALKMRYIVPFLLLLLAAGCGAPPPPPTTAQTYTVRGMVRQLPDPDAPGKEFLIRHEAIPEFVDREGVVVGMETMSMPFPVDPALIADLAPGDRIVFDFRMDWEGSPPLEVVRIEKLPEGTRLTFEQTSADVAAPEAAAPEAADAASDEEPDEATPSDDPSADASESHDSHDSHD